MPLSLLSEVMPSIARNYEILSERERTRKHAALASWFGRHFRYAGERDVSGFPVPDPQTFNTNDKDPLKLYAK